MASSVLSSEQQTTEVKRGLLIGGLSFDRIMVIFSSWFIGGVFLDGWAHTHGFVDNTFLTPWHGVLYSGYFATAIVLIGATIINHLRGQSWLKAIPSSYEIALLGVPLFTLAGAADLLWHTLFGFEVGIEPLLSPSHLLLALGGIMMVSGPLRATWYLARSNNHSGWRMLFPAILAAILVVSLFTFFLSFNNPIVDTFLITHHATNGDKSRLAAGIFLHAGLIIGMVLFLMRRWQLPIGSLTLIMTLNTTLMAVFYNEYKLIPTALLAGIIADLLYWRLKPSAEHLENLRLFAFVVPLVFYLLYFATLAITQGITWSIHLWLGASVLAGIVGLLLSYLMAPPPAPTE